MKLYRREFVRHLRRQVKREVKTRREWRREARRLPGRWNRKHGLQSLRWLVPLLWLGLVALHLPGHVLWFMLIFFAVGLTLNRTAQLQRLCSGADGLKTFVQVPVTTRQVWEYLQARVFRSSLWWLADLLAVLGLSAFLAGAWVGVWLAVVPLAILAWASVLATSVILYWRFPRAAYTAFGSLFWFVGLMTALTLKESGLHLEHLHWVLAWGTPPGWALQIAEWFLGQEGKFPVAAAGLLAGCLAYAVPCFRATAERFLFWQPEEKPFAHLPEDVTDEPGPAVARESRASEIEERIRGGDFLRPLLRTRQGWLDRMILRLCRSQAVIVDFLLGNSQPWSRPYLIGAMTILLAPLLANVAGLLAPAWRSWVMGIALFIGLARTTPLFGSPWPGFALGPMKPRSVAFFALLPVGLPDLRRCFLRINTLRFLAALPCWLVAGWCVSTILLVPPLQGLRYAACAWLGLLLFQPYFFIFKVSAGTNDTSSGCLNALIFLFLALLPFAIGIVTYLAVLLSWPWLWQVAAFLALGLTTFGFEAAYRRMYCGQRFDLLVKPRQ